MKHSSSSLSFPLSLLFLYVLSFLTFLFITSLFEKMKERTTAKKSMFGKDFKRERREKKREKEERKRKEDVLSVVERKKALSSRYRSENKVREKRERKKTRERKTRNERKMRERERKSQ